jgi:hypothetical protein
MNLQNTHSTIARAGAVTPRRVIDDLSDLARSVTISERPYYDHFNQRDSTEVIFALPGGFTLGARRDDGHLVLLHIGSTDYQQQQKGNGVAILQRAIKYAADNDLRFFANECLPSNVEPLVRAMQRRGYVVHIVDGAGWVHDGVPSVEFGTAALSFTEFDD